MNDEIMVFDRKLLAKRRERSAAAFDHFDFLYREVAERLSERLDDVRRAFPLALALGSRGSVLTDALRERGGIKVLIRSEIAESALAPPRPGLPAIVLDEEWLPIKPQSLDLIFACLTLHWVNDLPGTLLQFKQALKPDGLFLAAFFGGETLRELRTSLMDAELETCGGAGARISPFTDLSDAAGLMQRAGFALPVADLDRIPVSYPDVFKLLSDLRGMGETNALIERAANPISRDCLLRLAEIYGERHSRPDGKVEATFDVIFLTGWAPAGTQPQPLKPGSAEHSLAEALEHRKTGDGE